MNSIFLLLFINQMNKIKNSVSHVISADHHKHFFNQVTELIFADSVITVLVNLVQNVIHFFSCRVVDSDLLCDLDQNLLELASFEKTTSIDIDFSKCVLHQSFHLLWVLNQVFEILLIAHFHPLIRS